MGGGQAAQQDTRREKRATPEWWWIAVIALMGLAVALVGAVAATSTSGDWSKVWLEVTKAGVQVLAVGVAGGAITEAWKAITDRREREARTRDKIRAEFAELIDIYNGVKTVRRTLRSLGLDAKLHLDPKEAEDNEKRDKLYYLKSTGRAELKATGVAVRLTKEQADGFHEQMRTLNQLQLGYEARKRQFKQADLLGEDGSTVADTLASIERYLNHLVDLWEQHGWKIHEGTPLHTVSSWLQPLYRQRIFKRKFSSRMSHITEIINRHLFGPAKPDRRDKASDATSAASDQKADTEQQDAEHPPAMPSTGTYS